MAVFQDGRGNLKVKTLAAEEISTPAISATALSGTLTGDVSGNVSGTLTGAAVLPVYTVATLPAVATSARMLVFCSDGAAGDPCLAFCKPGTPNAWVQVALGAAVAAA